MEISQKKLFKKDDHKKSFSFLKKIVWRRFNYIGWKLGNSMKTSFKISLIFIEIAAKFSPDIFILFKKNIFIRHFAINSRI